MAEKASSRAGMGDVGAGTPWHEEGAILILERTGFWSPGDADQHFSALAAQLSRQRRRHGRARVLVDLNAVSVQAKEVTKNIQQGAAQAYKAGDRVALVTKSALVRLQLQRITGPAETMAFETMDAALRWLNEDAGQEA